MPDVVLTGDLVASRNLGTSAATILTEHLPALNRRFAEYLRIPFEAVRGDEFQGVLNTMTAVPQLTLEALARLYPVRVRFGVGESILDQKPAERHIVQISREAFSRAGDALETAKDEERVLCARTTTPRIDQVLGITIGLAAAIWKRWDQPVWRRLVAYLDSGTLKDVASQEGVSYQAIHKQFKQRNVFAVREALNALELYLGGITSSSSCS